MKELLKQFTTFQAFASKRALELIEAMGTRYTLNSTPDFFTVTETGVDVTFGEKTNHPSPDSESITLAVFELEMNEAEWADHLEAARKRAIEQKQKAEDQKIVDELATKERQYEQLKGAIEQLKKDLGRTSI